jgi:hypothetical protein
LLVFRKAAAGTLPTSVAYELDAEGIEFAYLCYLMRSDGQRIVVTVPVN